MTDIISSENAPAAIGPYSQGVKTGNLLFTAGQIAIDPKTGELNNNTVEDEVKQIMSNLKAVLKEGGSSLDRVVKTTIFLSDLDLYSEVNELYGQYFEDNPPARSAVEVARLPKNVRLEIEMIAECE